MVLRRDFVWVDFWDLSSFSHSLLLLVCIITNYCLFLGHLDPAASCEDPEVSGQDK